MLSNPNFKKHLPFTAITIIFLTVSLLDRLIPEGMFFDGTLYAALSRNLSIGKGTLWLPYVSHGTIFFEHPPLMFGIESLFFDLFGDHLYTEKIYSFTAWLITGFLITRLWKNISAEDNHRHAFWLPLLLWGLVPTMLWSYPNNMLECTMCIFDIAAVLLLYTDDKNRGYRILKVLFAGIFIVCASLVKGPVGLFPLAIPAIHWLVFKKYSLRSAVLRSLLLTGVVAAIYVILWQFEGPRHNLGTYLDYQLFSALAGAREKVDSALGRFAILEFLLTELAPPLILSALIIITARLLKLKPTRITYQRRNVIFFLLVGFCASLPIMVSIKQRSFYLVPSIPYFAIGLALLVMPALSALINRYRLPQRLSVYLNVALVVAAVASIPYLLKNVGRVGREHDLIHDLKIISATYPVADTVGMCADMEKDYPFLAYTERYHQIYVERKQDKKVNRLILNNTMCSPRFTDSITWAGFRKIDIGTWRYMIYERTAAPSYRNPYLIMTKAAQ